MPSDDPFDNPTVVATYATRYEAELAQSHLEENGIDSFISRDDTGGMDPHLQLTRGVRLVARRGQAVEARQILEWMDAVPQKRFAAPDDYVAQQRKMWRQLGTALLILGVVVLLVAVGLWTDGSRGTTMLAATGALMTVGGAALRWMFRMEVADAPASTAA